MRLLYLIVAACSTLIMAKPVDMMSSEPVPGTRHIWQHPPNMAPRIKFYSVPNEFTSDLIRHADLAGSRDIFSDGEMWLTVDGKRLFRMADDKSFWEELDKPDELASEIAMMTPQELTAALERFPAYREMHDRFLERWSKTEANKALGKLQARDSSLCAVANCRDLGDWFCQSFSESWGQCDTCTRNRCRWYDHSMPNWFPDQPSPF